MAQGFLRLLCKTGAALTPPENDYKAEDVDHNA
jgi:hypothetical protein